METYKINVGGTHFEILLESLKKYPDTVLGSLDKQSELYRADSDSFFFNRNPDFFNNILDLYRTDTLHLPSTICSASIRQELDFWKIPFERLCQCCQKEYFKYDREMELIKTLKQTFEENDLNYDSNDLRRSKVKRVLNKVWLFFDQPKSSRAATVFSIVFLMVVLLSLISFLLGSNSKFRDLREEFEDEFVLPYLVYNSSIRFFNELNLDNDKEVLFVTTIPKSELRVIDLFCTLFFFLEFAFHFISCPRKFRFFTYALNVIDFVLVVIMITLYILDTYITELIEYYAVTQLYMVLDALLVLRMCRLFRFMKLFSGFRILLLSLKASVKEFCLLFLSFMVASVFFASVIYYAEFRTTDIFSDIPQGIWWSIVTMTTVGYGDMYPKSGFGYVVGTLCAFGGIVILALPIAVVATNFNDFYDKNNEREDRKQLEQKGSHPKKLLHASQVSPMAKDSIMEDKVSSAKKPSDIS